MTEKSNNRNENGKDKDSALEKTSQKSGTLFDLLKDINNRLSNTKKWTRKDKSGVKPDGSKDNWKNYGCLYKNEDMGVYVLFFIGMGNGWYKNINNLSQHGSSYMNGIRVVYSNGWDSNKHKPSGKTTGWSEDPFTIENTKRESFDEYDDNDYRSKRVDSPAYGIMPFSEGNKTKRLKHKNDEVNYILSVEPNHVSAGVFNNKNAKKGMASIFSIEYIDKFWDDGNVPVAMTFQGNPNGEDRDNVTHEFDSKMGCYGFRAYTTSRNIDYTWSIRQCIKGGNWGFINPSTTDDTFFIRRPIIYNSLGGSTQTPIGRLRSIIPNQPSRGGSHGDDVTFDGKKYKIFRESGKMGNKLVSGGIQVPSK